MRLDTDLQDKGIQLLPGLACNYTLQYHKHSLFTLYAMLLICMQCCFCILP